MWCDHIQVNSYTPWRVKAMYLYEIKAKSFENKLMEQTPTDIEGNLEDTANRLKQSTGQGIGDMGPDDFGQAPDPEAGMSPLQQQQQGQDMMNEPDGDMFGGELSDEAQDEFLSKRLDSMVAASVKGHSYMTEWRHEESSKLHPFNILQMTLDELNQLITMARNKINVNIFSGDVSIYDSEDFKFFQDLVSFSEKVKSVKQQTSKDRNDKKTSRNAKFDKQKEPKNKERQEFKKKK